MAEIENLKIGANGTIHIVGNENIITEEWEASKTYVKDKSYVIREHKLYVCNVTHTSTSSFDPTKWTEITVIGAIDNALEMTDTASGAIATFESEYALPLRDLEIEINAVQESGTPSPSNPRAISGFSSGIIRVSSHSTVVETLTQMYVDTSGIVLYSLPIYPYKCVIARVNQGKQYTYSVNGVATTIPVLAFFDKYPLVGSQSYNSSRLLEQNATFTAPIDGFVFIRGSGDYNEVNQMVASGTSTEYEQGNTYTVDFGQTVYGGSLDVTTGVLTVDRAMVDLGSLTWQNNNIGTSSFEAYANFTQAKPYTTKLTSNVLEQKEPYTDVAEYTVRMRNDFLAVKVPKTVATSGEQVKQWLIDNNAILVYELATPVTYRLTPTQISAIVGTNNVFTDTNGDTTLEYYTKRGEQTVRIAEGVAVDVINNKNIDNLTTTNKTLVGAVNTLAPTAYTQATRSSALSSGALGYVKIGKVVIANLNYTTNTSNVSTHDTVLYSDLPPAISNIYLNFVDEAGNATRVRVGTDGKMHLHYSTITANKEINGSFVYLSA